MPPPAIGQIKLGHLEIRGDIMLFPVAVRDEEQIKLENLRRWMMSQGIRLGIMANFHAEHLEPKLMRVADRDSVERGSPG